MIYIVTILVVLVLVFHYDVNENIYNRMTAYYVLMCWFIAVSAFQYCLGSDTPPYMHEYDKTQWRDINWGNIISLNNRQFGWLLLINTCKLISRDYFALKLFQAAILNVAFFLFFKRRTKAIFTCIFFYSIFLYLDLNFNLVRQSIAVAIFLLGYNYYTEKKWLKYYFVAFGAIMFHNSAAILLFLPLLQLIHVNNKSFVTILVLFVISSVVTKTLPLTDLFLNYLGKFSGSDVVMLGNIYLSSEKYGQSDIRSVISFMTLLYLVVIYFNYKFDLCRSTADLLIVVAFTFLKDINASIPIFARLNFYLLPVFIYLLSNFVINFPTYKFANFKKSIIIFCIALFAFSPIQELFQENTAYYDRNLVQFYPYYTVFDKKVYPARARLFGSY